MKTLAQLFALLCLPLVLLMGVTVWVWFPVVCVYCAWMAAK